MRPSILSAAALAAVPACAQAHGFAALYNLPVPLTLYNWAASAALIVSFVVAAIALTGTTRGHPRSAPDMSAALAVRGLRHTMPVFRVVAVGLLLLCIATGFLGSRDPLRNFSMTFFWVIFVLLYTYLTALLGNSYAALNPWDTLARGLGRLWHGFAKGRVRYPAGLGDWPALALYLGFIGFELFGSGRPRALAEFLAVYTLLNLGGVWLVGRHAWFRHCEFFSVFLRLVALLAPLDYQRGDRNQPGTLHLRWPGAGLIVHRPTHLSTVTFVLAMLSTTTFDGLKATQWWVSLFWGDPTGWMTAWLGVSPVNALAIMRPWYIAWETFWLVVSPFIYLAAYLGTLWLARRLTGTTRAVAELARDFGYALLPIAIVYHVTHYATLILTHGLKIISLASDPFGWRWDLFGTAFLFRAPILPDMGVVWHTQVGLILGGHIVSVWVAHLIALRVFRSRGKATLSQLPMLVLMIGFTVAGLWILAQPLTMMLLR